MTSAGRIRLAQDFFRFAYRIGSPISYGLKFEMPAAPSSVIFGHHTLDATDLTLSDGAIAMSGVLLERLAYRLLAMELDSAITEKYKGHDRFEHEDEFVRNSSCVVRLIRNSVAHNILDPVWKIDRKLQGRRFTIGDIMDFDTNGPDGQGLNGKPLERRHFGGPIALFRLSEKWIPLLSEAQSP